MREFSTDKPWGFLQALDVVEMLNQLAKDDQKLSDSVQKCIDTLEKRIETLERRYEVKPSIGVTNKKRRV